MTHGRARLAVLALFAMCAVAVVVPAQANAFVSYYSCFNKPNLEWCDGRANGTYDGQHSWDYNSASNQTGGSFYVCQGVYKPSSGNWLAGHGCGLDWTSHIYGDVQCTCYDAEIAQASGTSQSINGFADAAL
jgi:hypothetical protein